MSGAHLGYRASERRATIVAASVLVQQFPDASQVDVSVSLFDGQNIRHVCAALGLKPNGFYQEVLAINQLREASAAGELTEPQQQHLALLMRLARAAPPALQAARRADRAPGFAAEVARAARQLRERFGAS